MSKCRRRAPAPSLIESRSPQRLGATEANRLSSRGPGSCDAGDRVGPLSLQARPGLQLVASRPTARRGSYTTKRCGTGCFPHAQAAPGRRYEYPCLIYPCVRCGHDPAVTSVDEPAGPSDPGERQNEHAPHETLGPRGCHPCRGRRHVRPIRRAGRRGRCPEDDHGSRRTARAKSLR